MEKANNNSEQKNVANPRTDCLMKISCGRAVLTVAVITGLAITIIGILAILGSAMPQVGFLKNVATITQKLATQLGTDPWTLSIITTSVGGGFLIGGTLGYFLLRAGGNHLKSLPDDDQTF